MRWLIVGTIPNDNFPFYQGSCHLESDRLQLGELNVPVHRGTPALLAAACAASRIMGTDAPQALLAGDTGHGLGSARIYEHLTRTFDFSSVDLLVFHYLQPDVDWHNRIYLAMEEYDSRPLLIADAGFMYVAKMSGFAASYDLFTPDVGEMAFLADETAPHPFYTRGFILQEEERIPELIRRAYQNENASRHLLVKGSCDIVACQDGIVERICEPSVEAMEPIGGTGDTLTGLVGAMVAAGHPIPRACSLAAGANRWMGAISNPTPAFAVAAMLPCLPRALAKILTLL
jgi:ADP-dependent NAD(P)H-hydrate dehydratase / NAD(P)H-hydrate epimerase